MFKQIYKNLCNKGQLLKEQYGPGSNLHKHHIIPRHSGGLDVNNNLTYLTVREHIIAHFLLWKIHKNPNDLRSMKMLGANLSVHQRRIVGLWCKENNIGWFGMSKEDKQAASRKGSKTQKDKKIGAFYDPVLRQTICSNGGKALKGMICVTNGKHRTRINPENVSEYLNSGYILGFTLFS